MKFAPVKWCPIPYQLRAATFLVKRVAAALWLDPGLGKTSVVYAAFKALRKRKLARKMLVIAPLRVVYEVWPAEASKWLDFVDLRVEILHGAKKEEALARDADVYVVNYEGIPWLRRSLPPAEIKKRGFDVLVLDEISKVKNVRSQRARLLHPILPLFKRRWGLTGTPAPNGLLDVFGQIYALDLGKSLGTLYNHFRVKYFLPIEHGWKWVPQQGTSDRIVKRLKNVALRMSAEEYLNLPSRTLTTIRIELPKKARAQYTTMEDVFYAELTEGKTISVVNPASSCGKCRQIASGTIYDEAHEAHKVHDKKLEALRDLADELSGHPLLIAYEFRSEIERIRSALGADTTTAPNIGGGVSPKKAKKILQRWDEGNVPFLLAHTQALGHGVNLQHGGRHVVFFTTTWNQEYYDQFIRRVWRMGQKRKVFVYHLVAKDTVDEAVLGALRKKTNVQDALLKALRAKRKGK